MKQQDQTTVRDLREMDISNIRDRESKAVIKKTLTGCEKRVEDRPLTER